MNEEKWFKLECVRSDSGSYDFRWPEETQQMWNAQLRKRIGLTSEEFGRFGLGGRYPIISYKIPCLSNYN